MKILFILMSCILISCKSIPPREKSDLLAKLIEIHREGSVTALTFTFGKPLQIEKANKSEVLKYVHKDKETGTRIESLVESEKNQLILSSIVFWKSNDDYELLKKRFGNYKWIEKPISTSSHPLRELYQVTIPELGISFEYDKLAPKIMWINFQKPQL